MFLLFDVPPKNIPLNDPEFLMPPLPPKPASWIFCASVWGSPCRLRPDRQHRHGEEHREQVATGENGTFPADNERLVDVLCG